MWRVWFKVVIGKTEYVGSFDRAYSMKANACKMAKQMLDKAGVEYTQVDAVENKDTTVKYGVNKAPTLLVPNGNGFDRYDNASLIRKYIEGLNG